MVNYFAAYWIFLVSVRTACSVSSESPDDETFELNRACEENWHLYGKYCYTLEGSDKEGRLSWENASVRCSSMGGHLASIHSEKQNEFLTNYMKWNTAFTAWIGLHDRRTEHVYEWVDGTTVDYENWLIQPSVATLPNNNDCVEILYRPSQRNLRISNVHGKWDDALCSARKAYICQKELLHNVSDDEDEEVVDNLPGYVLTSEDLNYKSTEYFIPCDDSWYYFDGKCYKIGGYESDDDHVTMQEASRLCSEASGKLTSIHSKEENDFLTFFLALNVKQIAWIGLNDREHESHYVWEDGSPLDYINWDFREPTDYLNNEDCVELRSEPYTKNAGKWNDLNCKRELAYICQKESNNTMKTPDPRFCLPEEGGGWKFRNSCYNIVNEAKSWEDAEKYCQNEFNGHLVHILDFTYDNFLGYVLRKSRIHTWIGIRKQDQFQQMWTSNMPVAYDHFDEPLEDIESGYCILRWNRNLWTSAACEEMHPFICERSSDHIPNLNPAPANFRCPENPPGWRDLGSEFCYYIDTESSITWVEAQIDCIKRGGILVNIKSKDEERILHHFIKDTKSGIHIGLNNVLTNGQLYVWSDGKKPVYTNWAANEPNNKFEKCAIVWTGDMKWNDVTCSYKSGYICQIKKVPVDSV